MHNNAAKVRHLLVLGEHLISIDARSHLFVWDIHARQLHADVSRCRILDGQVSIYVLTVCSDGDGRGYVLHQRYMSP